MTENQKPPRINLLMLFSEHLVARRHALKWSQGEVAKRAGLSVSFISMLEMGKRSPPLETVEAIARALGFDDPRSMFGRPGR